MPEFLDLLGRDRISFGGDPAFFFGQDVLVTGATGNIGSALVRSPNILCSSDSVLPIWVDQLASNQPLTLTDPEATRWFLTESEAIDLVLTVSVHGESESIHVPRLGDPVSMSELLHQFLASHRRSDHPVEVIGSRPGEKQHEVLFEYPRGGPSKIVGVGLDRVDFEA